jgi:uncharacterized protein YqeY
MISEKLVADMKDAMKSGDKPRLSVIRMLRAELKNAQIAAGEELTEPQEQKVVGSYAKKRKEAGQQAEQMGRADLAKKEAFEYSVAMSYLPAQMDEAGLMSVIKEKIDETGAQGPKDIGKVMKAVMAAVGSQADGSVVSKLVKKALVG